MLKKISWGYLIFSLSASIHAEAIQQIIKMHVYYVPPHIQKSLVCLKAGVLEKCGNEVVFTLKGDRTNWNVTTRNFWNRYTVDESCALFDEKMQNTTPAGSGQLDLYLTVEALNSLKTRSKFSNCTSFWKPLG